MRYNINERDPDTILTFAQVVTVVSQDELLPCVERCISISTHLKGACHWGTAHLPVFPERPPIP